VPSVPKNSAGELLVERGESGMKVNDFRQMYVTQLQQQCSVEDQLVRALPKMADMVQNNQLKQAIQHHFEETKSQRDKVNGLLRRHGAEAGEHQDQSIQTMVHEAERFGKTVSDPDCRDAAAIASAQRVEHYEIAAYGTLATWAKQLGLDEDAKTLHDILEQEKKTDEKLTKLAKTVVNPEAVEH
jgi:ferritin-like metal-binding protein YciE